MRIASATAIIASALALAGCGGSMPAGMDTLNLACGLDCDLNTGGTGTGGTTVPATIDPGTGDDTGTQGGNTTNVSPATGNTTLVLENGQLKKPASGTALSLLNATTDQLLAASKPKKLKFAVDTNTQTNGQWLVPVEMDEYETGTNRVDVWDTGNRGGSGTGYREYRYISNAVGDKRDEVLQLWTWGNSYATQYRNVNSGKAIQQAWAFGGNKTALTAVPTAGSSVYNGRFVGTANATNWVKIDGQPIDPNVDYRVQGAAAVTANFGTGAVTGQLTPETWTSYQPDIQMWFTQNVGGGYYTDADVAPPPHAQNTPITVNGVQIAPAPYYYAGIYNTKVKLNGTISGNTYTGTTTLDNGYVTGDNVLYGAFFGPTAAETTGIFAAYGANPAPIGGAAGINGDQRGYLTISGAFNATCTPGVTCAN
jgi:C-lobe and N-lobe beta barrels of Tf-binding protein B